MAAEIDLQFPDARHVVVTQAGVGTGALDFEDPFTPKDHQEIAWYIETYGARALGDPDDADAARIRDRLPVLGQRLFNAVFAHPAAARLFDRFQDAEPGPGPSGTPAETATRLLTVTALDPAVLALPWELLHDPSAPAGTFLFHERLSIRRRVAGVTGGRLPLPAEPRERLHLLFVVSRPGDASFIDPRADARAVLEALDAEAPGRVLCEFLRPPTLDALLDRLGRTDRPPVDILHFDGHGVFDRAGGLPARHRTARDRGLPLSEVPVQQKDSGPGSEEPPDTGYLLFEDAEGQADFVPAARLGANLHRRRVALVILSACQSAAVGGSAAAPAEAPPDAPADPGPAPDPAAVPADPAGTGALGGVAARLTATGIPAVLAMTHTVLVPTTRALFGEFYRQLARRLPVGAALDLARVRLYNHPEKYQVQRDQDRVWLRLQDWFIPALYQTGDDRPLLTTIPSPLVGEGQGWGAAVRTDANPGEGPGVGGVGGTGPRTNLPPPPETGFHGRRRELWTIERALAGPARRLTLNGFGGAGKTALAQESGRWLTRTGAFAAAVWVDYAANANRDALREALNAIGSVLDVTLRDAGEAEAVLCRTPTLVILDNLESLDCPDLRPALDALLDAAARWSDAGPAAAPGTRILCTTRRPDLRHPAYRTEGTLTHRVLTLSGLGTRYTPDDALDWFAALARLPPPPLRPAPGRQALIDLFERVDWHPLSIRVLVQPLKTRAPADLGARLESLLPHQPLPSPSGGGAGGEGTPASLVASLRLSLDPLDPAARAILPRLGVFQGGAMEDSLLAVTGLDAPVDGAPAWPDLRRQLETAALIAPEPVPGVGVPYLRFHPTLAPLLWGEVPAAEQGRLAAAHRARYAGLAGSLYDEDDRHPHEVRAIARLELPNLLHACHGALATGETDAVGFADSLNRFLVYFGLGRESADLLERAGAAVRGDDPRAWYLAQSNQGERLLAAGRIREALGCFESILARLGEDPGYERAVTLGLLGRCLADGGRPDLAAARQREKIAVLDRLVQTDRVRRERGVALTDLADALRNTGDYAGARAAYEAGLEVDRSLGDERSQGVSLGQLGTLAMREGRLDEAERRFREALDLFQRLREPATEAIVWHQLGVVYRRAGRWDESERHYREAARIHEQQGNLARAAETWNNLAGVTQEAGRLEAAEHWYRQAIQGFREIGDRVSPSKVLSNLANLLQSQPGRLPEARRLAEESLAIKETLDPGAAEIWTIYNILAEIADREAAAAPDAGDRTALAAEARTRRARARAAWRAFPPSRRRLQRFLPLIRLAVTALGPPPDGRPAGPAPGPRGWWRRLPLLRPRPDRPAGAGAPDPQAVRAARESLEQELPKLESAGWTALAAALRRLLAGERDLDALCAGLDRESGLTIETLLAAWSDPAALAGLEEDGV